MRSVGVRFLLPFTALAVLFSLFVLHRAYVASRRHAEELIGRQAALALEFNLAIRNYVSREIRPVMERLVDQDEFIPETMSTSFISRRVFEEVRKELPEYVIRFASEQPRNPVNQAQPDELRWLEFFRAHPEVARRTNEIQIGGRRYQAHITPRRATPDCLRCHGEPRDAPAAMVRRYGSTDGFHWRVGDVVGLDTVAVPDEVAHATLGAEMRRQALVLAAGMTVLFLSVTWVFRRVVSRRLASLATHFHQIATHPEDTRLAPIAVGADDEIGVVASAFNALVERLRTAQATLEERVRQRTAELTRTNEELQHEMAQRRRTEAALRDTTREMEAFFNVTLDLLCVADTSARFRRLNPAWERALGYDRTELLAHRFLDLVHPDDVPSTLQAVAALESQREVRDFVNRYRCRDGSYRWLEWRSAPDGELIYAAARDVTERKAAEEALARSEAMMRGIFRAAPIGISVFSAELRFLSVNESTVDLFGYAPEQLLGEKSDLLYFHTEDYERVIRDLQRERGRQGRTQTEARMRRRDGAEIHALLSASPLRADQPGGEVVVTALDITQRKRAEQALQSSLEEKTALLKEVHHRVKNNLQIVSSLLSLQTARERDASALAALQDTQNRVRAMALIHETLYRSENLARLDFPRYVHGLCAHLLQAYGGESGRVRLAVQVADVALTLDAAVPCGLIINELVTNALKHAFPDERTGRILVEWRTDAEGCRVLRVADDGVGLPPGLDICRPESLGLRLVRGLADQMGGTMTWEGTVGTAFCLRFPAAHRGERGTP